MKIFCALLFCFAGCTSPADVGEPCADSADCMEDLSCFARGDENVCMRDCDYEGERFCEDGSVCTMATGPGRPADLGVCYLGGTTAVGSPCETNLECVQGSVCVDNDGAQTCYRACTVGVEGDCETGEVCSMLEAMGDRGFCEADPGM